MKQILNIIFIFTSFVFSECPDLQELECNNDSNCEWIENIETGICDQLDATECIEIENTTGDCWWYGGTYYGPYCYGSYYDIDNSYCDYVNNQQCEEIEQQYISLHSGNSIVCENDIDCIVSLGHCSVGLGECYYSVNNSYNENAVINLVDLWNENDCMEWVCDCPDIPQAICIDNNCDLADCSEPNPAGCFQTGCPNGYECIDDPYSCTSSFCGCDELYDAWICTEDCGGGTCIPIDILYGDLNFDNFINISDIVLLLNMILNPDDIYIPEMFTAADFDQDGDINILDVILIVNFIINN